MKAIELEQIVGRLLEEGVPPGVVARVFDLEVDLVKDAQADLRVRKYGTADMDDYIEIMEWEAIDKTRQVIANGAAGDQLKYALAVLSKRMSATARRKPESERDRRGSVEELLGKMRKGNAEATHERSQFVVLEGGKEE